MDDVEWEGRWAVALPKLRGYLRTRLGGRGGPDGYTDADDLVQETAVRAWTHRHHYDPALGDFGNWVVAIASRVVVDRLRSRAKKLADIVTAWPTNPEDGEALDPSTSEETGYAEVEGADIICLLLWGLRPLERDLLILKYVRDKRNKDTAVALGYNDSTLIYHERRARKAIQGRWDPVALGVIG